ncbi:MAG: hypothetical protein U1E17_18085 [Geminicoccaceae bacterium]
MSGAITAALLVAFVLGSLVEGTRPMPGSPYADPAVLAVVYKPIRTLAHQHDPPGLVEDPPPRPAKAGQRGVEANGGRQQPATACSAHAYVAKIGRSRQMEIHFFLPPDRPLGNVRIRCDPRRGRGGDRRRECRRWLTITFTGDPSGRAEQQFGRPEVLAQAPRCAR